MIERDGDKYTWGFNGCIPPLLLSLMGAGAGKIHGTHWGFFRYPSSILICLVWFLFFLGMVRVRMPFL